VNKKWNIGIIISILLIAICLVVAIQNKNIYIQNYIKQQVSIFKTPIPFIHKIQYFYDKAIINYLNGNPQEAIKNLEISEAFISTANFSLQETKNIIDKTIYNIKENKKFDYLSYQHKLYLNLSNITYNYYIKSHNMIKTLNKFLDKNRKTNIALQIIIFLLALLLIFIYILYILKENTKINSLIDPLTFSFNRRSFFEDIKNLSFNTHTLVMADIDHFKKINDTYGHDAGDLVLKELVNIIKENIRKEDKIYRWGGEEFIILFKDMTAEQAQNKIKDIKSKIENYNFNGIKITASFGIKEITGTPNNQDLKILDNALYVSKEKGRNKITILN